jgi:hypothetical protein
MAALHFEVMRRRRGPGVDLRLCSKQFRDFIGKVNGTAVPAIELIEL